MSEGTTDLLSRVPTPGPRALAVATVVAFGGAVLVFNVKPFGLYLAAALMAGWLGVAMLNAFRQAERDGTIDRSPPRPVWARLVLTGFDLVIALSVGAAFYALWWTDHGGPKTTAKDYEQGAQGVAVLGMILRASIDWLVGRLARADAVDQVQGER